MFPFISLNLLLLIHHQFFINAVNEWSCQLIVLSETKRVRGREEMERQTEREERERQTERERERDRETERERDRTRVV